MTSTDAQNHFKNENLSVEVEFQPGCQIVGHVSVEPAPVGAAYQSALKKVSKQVSLPGFRKGKAPTQLIESQFAKYVEQEWHDEVMRTSFAEMLKLVGRQPLNERAIHRPKVESCCRKEGAKIVFTYEAEPEVPEIKEDGLEIASVEKKPVEDDAVEKATRELRLHHATWEKVEEERAVEEGDFIDVDIENIGVDPAQSICKDRRFEVVEGKIGAWLKELVIGMKVGESREGESTVDPKAPEEVKAKFEPTKCKVTLNAIQKPTLPELDEEFAKKMGLKKAEELVEKVREQLEKDEEARVQNERKELLQDKLLEAYPFEVPVSLKESERSLRIKERIRELVSQGLSEEAIKGKEKEIEEEVAQEVDAALRIFFLLRKHAEKEGIRVTNEETANALMREMYRFPISEKTKKPEVPPEVYAQVFSNLLIDKVKKHLLDKVSSQ